MDITNKRLDSSELQALTLLLLQNQDLSNLSPKELHAKYCKIYKELSEAGDLPKAKIIKNHDLPL